MYFLLTPLCAFSLLFSHPQQEIEPELHSVRHEVVVPGDGWENTRVSVPSFNSNLGTLVGYKLQAGLEVKWYLQMENLSEDDSSFVYGVMSWNPYQNGSHYPFPNEVGGAGSSWWKMRVKMQNETASPTSETYNKKEAPVLYAINSEGSRLAAPFDGVIDFQGPSALNTIVLQELTFKGNNYVTEFNLGNLVNNPVVVEVYYSRIQKWMLGFQHASINVGSDVHSVVAIEYFYEI